MLSIVYVASLSVMVIYTVQLSLSFKYQPVCYLTGNKMYGPPRYCNYNISNNGVGLR